MTLKIFHGIFFSVCIVFHLYVSSRRTEIPISTSFDSFCSLCSVFSSPHLSLKLLQWEGSSVISRSNWNPNSFQKFFLNILKLDIPSVDPLQHFPLSCLVDPYSILSPICKTLVP